MKIILITETATGRKWLYTANRAAREHVANPLLISGRTWSNVTRRVKKEQAAAGEDPTGYPFKHSGCLVECFEALTGSEVDANNEKLISREVHTQ